MPVIDRIGDIFEQDWTVLAHGCNCFNTMGAGVARQVKLHFPEAFAVDQQANRHATARKYGSTFDLLGTFSMVAFDEDAPPERRGKRVYNLYTQYNYGLDRSHIDYFSLEKAMKKMRWDLRHDRVYREAKIAMPKIGCGLAGGEWRIVREIIGSVFYDQDARIYSLE